MITPDITRIEKARAERRLQLIKWDEYDRAYQSTEDTKHRSKQSKTVAFGADLIFLEAAARGDIKEECKNDSIRNCEVKYRCFCNGRCHIVKKYLGGSVMVLLMLMSRFIE
uniref:Protein Wnt n=1 Tax=Mesocestoides corti TaxID=53468 RepID=A0A5K3FNA3_MESCO